jgi:hypothetical protein
MDRGIGSEEKGRVGEWENGRGVITAQKMELWVPLLGGARGGFKIITVNQ